MFDRLLYHNDLATWTSPCFQSQKCCNQPEVISGFTSKKTPNTPHKQKPQLIRPSYYSVISVRRYENICKNMRTYEWYSVLPILHTEYIWKDLQKVSALSPWTCLLTSCLELCSFSVLSATAVSYKPLYSGISLMWHFVAYSSFFLTSESLGIISLNPGSQNQN